MGRNKDLRRKIVSTKRMVEEHESKIRRERMKSHPDEDLIAHWETEINVWKDQVEQWTRRLRREW